MKKIRAGRAPNETRPRTSTVAQSGTGRGQNLMEMAH